MLYISLPSHLCVFDSILTFLSPRIDQPCTDDEFYDEVTTALLTLPKGAIQDIPIIVKVAVWCST